MKQRQQGPIQRVRDVRQFIDNHENELPGISGTSAYAKLAVYDAGFSEHGITQDESKVTAKTVTISAQSIARDLAVHYLSPMSAIASDELPNVPELRAFHLQWNKLGTVRMRVIAPAMAKAAAPYKAVFIKAGLRPDFLEQIAALTAAIDDATTHRNAHQQRTSGATGEIRALERASARTIRTLDRLVRSAAHGNASVLGGWARAKRLRQTPTGTAADTTTTIPATDVTSPSAAAA